MGQFDESTPGRRSFVQSVLGMGGFTVPAVRTFLMAAVATVTVPEAVLAVATPSPSTTSATTTSTTTTTTTSTTTSTTTAFFTTTAIPTTTGAVTTAPGTTASPGGGGGNASVPEIDAGSAASALALLASVTVIVRDRNRSTDGPANTEPGSGK